MSGPGRTPALRAQLIWPAFGVYHECGTLLAVDRNQTRELNILRCLTCGFWWHQMRLDRYSDAELAERFYVAPPRPTGDDSLVEVRDDVNRVRYLALRPTGLLAPGESKAEVTL